MGERDQLEEWDGASVTRELVVVPAPRGPLARLGARLDGLFGWAVELIRRRGASTDPDAAPLARTGGPIARWISFPRGVRVATAATSTATAGLAAWSVLALAGHEPGVAAAAAVAGAALTSAWGAIGVRLANRLHRLV